MCSVERSLSLIDKTEANLRRIEELQSALVVPMPRLILPGGCRGGSVRRRPARAAGT